MNKFTSILALAALALSGAGVQALPAKFDSEDFDNDLELVNMQRMLNSNSSANSNTTAAPAAPPPVTSAPTTAAPTTAAPTTAAPTTAAATTAAPTSAPTTAAPTTAAATTAAPTSAPSTAAPTSAAGSTAAPTTSTPVPVGSVIIVSVVELTSEVDDGATGETLMENAAFVGGLRTGIAGAVPGVEPSQVQITGITVSRRRRQLSEGSVITRRLAAATLAINYTITVADQAAADTVVASVGEGGASAAAFEAAVVGTITQALTDNGVTTISVSAAVAKPATLTVVTAAPTTTVAPTTAAAVVTTKAATTAASATTAAPADNTAMFAGIGAVVVGLVVIGGIVASGKGKAQPVEAPKQEETV